MKLHHIALCVKDLESMRAFYERCFGAVANDRYHNPKTGLKTYFLTFDGGGRLELMSRPDVTRMPVGAIINRPSAGYAHLAVGAGSRDEVDHVTEWLRRDGYTVVSGPRVTGDGYYESCVLDPEGNLIEIVE